MLALLQRNDGTDREATALMSLGIASIIAYVSYFTLNFVGVLEGRGVILSWIMTALVAPTALGAVWLAARGVRGPVGWLMELTPLVYLGRISYGLYIFHPFIPPGVAKVLRSLHVPIAGMFAPQLLFALNLVVLVGVSSLSWHFFEKRINGLKRFFPYTSPSRVDTSCLEQRHLTCA
jgi:peptidoglycan/LPS O-acetylase OafA/YrhL